MNCFMTYLFSCQATTRSEQHRDVENQTSVVVDHGAPVDDTALITLRNDDELGLEIHRHRTNPSLPATRHISASVLHASHVRRQWTIVRTIVIADHDHIVRTKIATVGLVHDDLTAMLVMVPSIVGFSTTREHRSTEKHAGHNHSH